MEIIQQQLFQKPMLYVNAVFQADVLATLAIALHGAACGTRTEGGNKYSGGAKGKKESFHNGKFG